LEPKSDFWSKITFLGTMVARSQIWLPVCEFVRSPKCTFCYKIALWAQKSLFAPKVYFVPKMHFWAQKVILE
jgi:hypothetical protein